MKKLNLLLQGQEKLSKEQMKKITGGKAYACYIMNPDGTRSDHYWNVTASNGCEAQSIADAYAYSGQSSACCGFDCDYPGEYCD